MLESCETRAAAVVCLAQFAIAISSLKPSILVLIHRCFYDNDDEVRDRACFYYSMLRDENSATLIIDVPLTSPGLWLKALDIYINEGNFSAPFEVAAVADLQKIAETEVPKSISVARNRFSFNVALISFEPLSQEIKSSFTELQPLTQILNISSTHTFSHVSKPQHLTDSDAEFDIICFKHMFSDLVIFEVCNIVQYKVCYTKYT
uniref:Coatomer subunit gamma (Trinotate prediction) n=1 Tax=Henneguya salminicola TaxID=69463 RepID=A0A6G3MFV3_HENSL